MQCGLAIILYQRLRGQDNRMLIVMDPVLRLRGVNKLGQQR